MQNENDSNPTQRERNAARKANIHSEGDGTHRKRVKVDLIIMSDIKNYVITCCYIIISSSVNSFS